MEEIIEITNRKTDESENKQMTQIEEPLLKKEKGIFNKIANTTKKANKKPIPEKEQEDYKPKEPLLQMIYADGHTEWFEKAKEGRIEITRTDKKTAIINLPLSKLQTMHWGNDTLKYWIAYEKESTAYPCDTQMDSALQYQYTSEIISNTKNYEAQKINAWANLGGQIVIILIVAAILIYFAVDYFGLLKPQETKETVKTTIITDTNTITTTAENDYLKVNKWLLSSV